MKTRVRGVSGEASSEPPFVPFSLTQPSIFTDAAVETQQTMTAIVSSGVGAQVATSTAPGATVASGSPSSSPSSSSAATPKPSNAGTAQFVVDVGSMIFAGSLLALVAA
jgi:hypothetical protein